MIRLHTKTIKYQCYNNNAVNGILKVPWKLDDKYILVRYICMIPANLVKLSHVLLQICMYIHMYKGGFETFALVIRGTARHQTWSGPSPVSGRLPLPRGSCSSRWCHLCDDIDV
jgi:hypothetical protein